MNRITHWFYDYFLSKGVSEITAKYLNMLVLLLALLIITACNSNQSKETKNLNLNKKTSTIQIDKNRTLRNLKILASDSLEGRGFTKPGNYKAQQLIANTRNDISYLR